MNEEKLKEKTLRQKDKVVKLLTTLETEFNGLNLWLKELKKHDCLIEGEFKIFEEFISNSKKELRSMHLGLKALEGTLTISAWQKPSS